MLQVERERDLTKCIQANCNDFKHFSVCVTTASYLLYFTGPWVTFEIQLPQDDFHLLAWVLGERISQGELDEARRTYHLRGLESDEKLLDGRKCANSIATAMDKFCCCIYDIIK